MRHFQNLIIGFIVVLAGACSPADRKTFLQDATGRPGDLVIIMDSLQWKGPVANELNNIFSGETEGLPRPQPMFDVKWVHPSTKIGLIKQVRNLVMVFTLDQQTQGTKLLLKDFAPETIQKIQNDSSFYMSTIEDEYSKGQMVMYLFGRNSQELAHHLQEHETQITDFFKDQERKRLVAELEKPHSTRKITDGLRKQQHCSLYLTAGYKLADEEKGFVWYRQVETETDQSVFIAWKPYESQYQLQPDSLVAWRNDITQHHIFEDPDNPETYMTTETAISSHPVIARQININGNYAMEIRGLWKIPTAIMGGPFVAAGLVDKGNNRLYYIEGFTYSPGRDQREIIRQLEAILYTFRTSDQLPK